MRLFSCLLLFVGLAVVSPSTAADKTISFSRYIKPILAGKCYACHGPDEAERKGEFRLDVREVALEKHVFKPGNSKESELILRVTSTDPEMKMPPATSKKPALTEQEIELIRKWIDQGAEYDQHWSYLKPLRAPLPPVKDAGWPAGDIDRFVLASIEEAGLRPSPEGDKRTLLRRLSFDLTGLPPTPQQLADFEADKSPQAYEKVVDRLLAQPQYGERMAMYWLDVVRYADTAGYHSDNHRDIASFRDYVIGAFNQNKPFDLFTQEQLAGDLMVNATTEQRIASGYNKLLQTTEEGGAQPKEYAAKYAADRVRNTSVIWLAGTMGCCECHNHKFDPYTQKDFYSFAAFFADVSEKAVGRQDQTKIPTLEQEQRIAAIDVELAAWKGKRNTQTPELDAALAKWEAAAQEELAKNVSAWTPIKPEAAESQGGSKLETKDDLSVISTGANPAQDMYTVTLSTDQERLTGIRLEALTDETFGNKSLSRGNGNFVLTGFEVQAASLGGDVMPVKLSAAEADFSQATYPVANAIDDKANTGWAVSGHEKAANHIAVFTFAAPISGGPGTKIIVKMQHQSQFAQHNIGRFRLALTTADKPSLSETGLPADIVEIVKADAAGRNDAQKQKLAAYYRGIAPELADARGQVVKLEAEKKSIVDTAPQTLVSMAAAPRTMRILPRGNWLDDSGQEVFPAVPEFLTSVVAVPSDPAAPSGRAANARLTRLDFARWVTSRDNPLTARVFVNRLWKLTFGRGLSRSLEDFGTQGEYPTHPELLDWLAVDFMESGWDVKRLVKLMVMSKTYRQSSLVSPELKENDPLNNYFARQDRFRLDAELVRDNALALSGLLTRKIGGPSVKPYQPAGYWQYLNFPTREWMNDHGDDLYRRGLYTYWQRTFLNPSLLAFDAPSREECTVNRPRSNTPQQALVLLNDPTYVEAARALAVRIVKDGGGDSGKRLEFAFREVLTRSPRESEVKVLVPLYEKHLQQYKADAASADKLLAVGESKPPADLDKAELAAWTSIARVLLNLHETITRN
ncbi:MAG: PSD1 domain-containing protein [Pirellulaceae bacterium]|nr:PSD1 domain-containing protein [Pirellulaceae bacterium]